ncbi:MAG: LptE family protein [Planctomycetia bacterium]|nr:LptE family protein [Planctomycetia bacterium]
MKYLQSTSYQNMAKHKYQSQYSSNQTAHSAPPFARGNTGWRKKTYRKKKFLWSNTIMSFAYLALLFLFITSLESCGYSSKSLLRSNVRSIYVPIFDNNTFRRGYEFDLTKAVRDQILLRTRLNIVDKDEADSVLFGKITSVNENVLIENTRDNIVESRVSVGIEIRWVDRRTGRTIVERKNIKRQAEFIVSRNETLTSSSKESFVIVAQGVVDAMEEDW